MPLVLTPWAAGEDCHEIESEGATPQSFSVSVSINVSQTDAAPGFGWELTAAGSVTSDRVPWPIVISGLPGQNEFAIGRKECNQQDDGTSAIIKGGEDDADAFYLAHDESDVTETTTDPINGAVPDDYTSALDLWIQNSALTEFAFEASTAGYIGNTGTISPVSQFTLAELISGSPFVVNDIVDFIDGFGRHIEGTASWTFTVG